jgi:protein-tyrosine phosphatase
VRGQLYRVLVTPSFGARSGPPEGYCGAGVIDLHCHLLPALDDGPGSLAGSVEMARAAHDAGIHTIVCTPHMMDRYPTDPRRVVEQVGQLRDALDLAGVPVAILQGGEIALPYLSRLDDEELRLASVGGAGRWLMLEMPFQGWPISLPQTLADLELRGYGVILAHPERAESIQRAPDRIRDLVGRGALVQLTAASFLGEHGPAARRAALMLLAGGVAHFLATDAHSAGPWRPPELEEGLHAAAEGIDVHPQTLRWMVEEGPAAVVEGRPVRPPRLTPRRRPRVDVSPAPGGPPQRTRG